MGGKYSPPHKPTDPPPNPSHKGRGVDSKINIIIIIMIMRNYVTGGLKAQKHLAQGIALGLVSELVRPARAKAPI